MAPAAPWSDTPRRQGAVRAAARVASRVEPFGDGFA